MGQDKLLDLFFEEPNSVYKMREIARITKIPKTTVARRLKELAKEKLILKKRNTGYIANESGSYFRFCKKIRYLEVIYKSGVIKYLEEHFNPTSIILFGSFSKGEYNRDSDIDIFVQTKEREYNVTKFERKLKHKINLFFEEDFAKLSNELFNNIINGIKLAGYIKIR